MLSLLSVALLCLALACALDAAGEPEAPWRVEPGVRQLFLDDAGIESMAGLRRVLHQPRRHPENPVLRGEHPWEMASVSVYGTALYDPRLRRFRLWYLSTPGSRPDGRPWVEAGGFRRVTNCTLLAYAVSRDGVRWEKPVLEQLSFEGSRRNNLVDVGIDNPEGVSVLFDPRDPDPARRYKALFWDRRVSPPAGPENADTARVPAEPPGLTPRQAAGGIWVAFSPDGLRWKTHGPVLPQGSDTTQAVVFDPRLGRYVAFGRFGFGRRVARTESADFLHWSDPRLVLECDAEDGPGTQVYGMPVDLYEGLYLGMLWVYREGTDGRIDTQLAMSRDGVRWRRLGERETFLPNAPEGARDDGMSRGVGRIIARGDRLYLYYSMVNGPHRGPRFPNPERRFPPAVGLAILRRDGFVSLDAGDAPGTLLTRAFALPAGRLRVNVETEGGSVRVALCDASGRPLPGLTASRAVTGDAPRAAVRWDRGEPGGYGGKPVRLRFTLERARLYSYWFE